MFSNGPLPGSRKQPACEELRATRANSSPLSPLFGPKDKSVDPMTSSDEEWDSLSMGLSEKGDSGSESESHSASSPRRSTCSFSDLGRLLTLTGDSYYPISRVYISELGSDSSSDESGDEEGSSDFFSVRPPRVASLIAYLFAHSPFARRR